MTTAKQSYITQIMKNSITTIDISKRTYVYEESEQALNTIEDLFNNASYSDVMIRFGTNGIQIPAHRMILATYTPLLNDILSKTPETNLEILLNDCSVHSYWRVFHYMYKQMYSVEATEVLGNADDEPDLLVYATVALLARNQFYIQELEEYALERLQSQLHGWSTSELFEGIQEMYATQNKAARQIVITEETRSYSQVPQLAQALQKAAREIGDFAADLVEALGNIQGPLKD